MSSEGPDGTGEREVEAADASTDEDGEGDADADGTDASSRPAGAGTTLRAFVRFVYVEIVPVSLVSLLGSLLLLPVVTAGPALLAATATIEEVAASRGTERRLSDRDVPRVFLGAVREYALSGLTFSAILIAAGAILGVYLSLALRVGSAPLWFGAALALYTLVGVVVLAVRAAHLLARDDEAPETAVDAMVRGVAVAAERPGYSAVHVSLAGALLAGTVLLTPSVPVLLLGSLAALEIVVYEELRGDGVRPLLESLR